jgi:hypothetical protein
MCTIFHMKYFLALYSSEPYEDCLLFRESLFYTPRAVYIPSLLINIIQYMICTCPPYEQRAIWRKANLWWTQAARPFVNPVLACVSSAMSSSPASRPPVAGRGRHRTIGRRHGRHDGAAWSIMATGSRPGRLCSRLRKKEKAIRGRRRDVRRRCNGGRTRPRRSQRKGTGIRPFTTEAALQLAKSI